MAQILIFEPSPFGHRLQYVRWIAEQALSAGNQVIFATTRYAAASDEFAIHLGEITSKLIVDAAASEPISSSLIRTALYKARSLREFSFRHSPTRVIVPYADSGLSQAAAIMTKAGHRLFPSMTTADAIIMRGGFAYPSSNALQRAFRVACRKSLDWVPWQRVFFIDEIAFRHVMSRGGRIAAKARYLPDPAEAVPDVGRQEARRSLGIPEGGRYIGTCGTLDARKGVDQLLRAFSAAQLNTSDRLLLVGKLHGSLTADLQAARDRVGGARIIVIDRYVREAELNQAISAMDVVCTPYPCHIGSSSVVIRAATMSRPVLGHSFGWIQKVVTESQLGWTCPFHSLPQEIQRSLDRSAGWQPSAVAKEFVARHSVAEFKRRLELGRLDV